MRAGRRVRPDPAGSAGPEPPDAGPIGAAGAAVAETRAAVAERETLAECLRKLVQLLPQVSRGLRRRQLPAGPSEFRLGPRHGVALSLLDKQGPLTVGQLAAQLGVTLPTASGIVADVERSGFAQRSADPGDRRRIIVSLVSPNSAALGDWLDGATAPMARALHQLSPAERLTFLKAMTLLEAELSTDDPAKHAHRAQPEDRQPESPCPSATGDAQPWCG